MDRLEVIRGLRAIRDPEFLFAHRYVADAGIDLTTQPHKARAYLEERALAGDAAAQLSLAKFLISGVVGEINLSQALRLCRQAAEAQYGPAFVLLSSFYSEGWASVQKDKDQALKLLQKGSEAGYGHAMALLSVTYTEGILAERNIEKGRMYLVMAAEHGDANSQFILGTELLDSKDEPQRNAGVRWIIAAADQDLAPAHRQLAYLYGEGGAGLSRDEARSRFHRRRADELEPGDN